MPVTLPIFRMSTDIACQLGAVPFHIAQKTPKALTSQWLIVAADCYAPNGQIDYTHNYAWKLDPEAYLTERP